MEEADVFKLVCVRVGGVLVGYSGYTVAPCIHTRTVLCAECNVIYVEPRHRGRAALALIRWVERELDREGVRLRYYAAKPGSGFGDVLRHLGYTAEEMRYVKVA